MNAKSEKIITLKRNDEAEKNLNYKKIYDLSKIDMLGDIDPSKKYYLLIAIKKILLCTNKYVDICNIKEILQYCLMSFIIFIIYIVIISPIIKIYLLTEEESISLDEFNVIKKFYYYWCSQMIEIIFRLIFMYYRKKKVMRIFMHYANNEIKKVKKYFNIKIDENNFDLRICENKDLYYNYNYKSINEDDDFYQYVICYPNVRYYNWDKKILNIEEELISTEVKYHIQAIEDDSLMNSSYVAIIIGIIYILSFYCLTVGKLKMFFFHMFVLFFFTKVMSFVISSKMKEKFISKEEDMSKLYIKKGYFINFSSCVILIFKLKDIYKDSGKEENEIYKILYKQVRNIINMYNIF
jgi:hypothetical protein